LPRIYSVPHDEGAVKRSCYCFHPKALGFSALDSG
jgi:hypothetical protein